MSFVPRSHSASKSFFGVEEAIVTKVEDDDTQFAQEGRVWVKLVRRDDQMELVCRLCQPYAGNGYGFFYSPEIGDEVLVAFIQGDMRFPIILGGLFNGQDKPPTYRSSDKNQKMIKTKSGHVITLDDSAGNEKIEIVDKSGDNSILIDTNNNAISITAKTGKLTLSANEVEIKSQTSMKIEASATLDVKGQTINLN